jgi:Domain of unknown function (DUF4270)
MQQPNIAFKNFTNNIIKVVVMTAFVLSCTEDTLPLDGELNSNLYNVIDTFNVTATSILDTGNDLTDHSLSPVGVLNDNVFGKTTTGVYTSLQLPYNNIDLGTGVTYDSMVLALAYGGTYGTFASGIDIKVYELTTEIAHNTSYVSKSLFNSNSNAIGSISNLIPNSKDSVKINGINQYPQCRIKMDDVFGKKIFDASGQSPLKDNASFKAFLKGFYIKSTDKSSENGMAYFSMFHPATKLILYYSKNNVAASLEFPIQAASDFVNNYQIDRSTTSATINSKNPNGDEVLYISGLEGTIGQIHLPNLSVLKTKVVNKAELIFTVDNAMQGLPSRLYLNTLDSFSKSTVKIDDAFYNYPLFDGKLRSNYLNGNLVYQYVFDISKHVQLFAKNPQIYNSYLYLHAGELEPYGVISSRYRANRFTIVGNKPQGKIKLKVTYLK